MGVANFDTKSWQCIAWQDINAPQIIPINFVPQVVSDVKAYTAYPLARDANPPKTECAKLVIAENDPLRYKIGENPSATSPETLYSPVPWIIATSAEPKKCLTLKTEGIKFEGCGSAIPTNHVYPSQIWKVGGFNPDPGDYKSQIIHGYHTAADAADILTTPRFTAIMQYNSNSFLANVDGKDGDAGNILAITGFDYDVTKQNSARIRFATNDPISDLVQYPSILNTLIENGGKCLGMAADSFAVFIDKSDTSKCLRVNISRYLGH